uniref:Protein kinase domain-containing protein n=1 Tax=Maylandia zebra TaxID=106582 RepID=A0A3P9DUK7_9CICH
MVLIICDIYYCVHTLLGEMRLNQFTDQADTFHHHFGKALQGRGFPGEGGFGIVAKCRDTMTNRAVAIKVNKSRPDILQQAKLEIFILEQLRRLDSDAANIVQWDGFFHDGERVCLKFELLDQCLRDYIWDRKNHCLPISEVRPILGQLTNALSHLGSVGMVHADLKPGNIMVVNRHESPIKVKLIDFGLACPASAVMPGDRVGTVGYCAPEVMLGLPYNEAIDMWSLGLVAVELVPTAPRHIQKIFLFIYVLLVYLFLHPALSLFFNSPFCCDALDISKPHKFSLNFQPNFPILSLEHVQPSPLTGPRPLFSQLPVWPPKSNTGPNQPFLLLCSFSLHLFSLFLAVNSQHGKYELRQSNAVLSHSHVTGTLSSL